MDIQRAMPLKVIWIFSIVYENYVILIKYRIVVGYRPTVAVFKTFEPVPLATRSVSKLVCNHGTLTNTQAMPQAPLPAKIETISKEKWANGSMSNENDGLHTLTYIWLRISILCLSIVQQWNKHLRRVPVRLFLVVMLSFLILSRISIQNNENNVVASFIYTWTFCFSRNLLCYFQLLCCSAAMVLYWWYHTSFPSDFGPHAVPFYLKFRHKIRWTLATYRKC